MTFPRMYFQAALQRQILRERIRRFVRRHIVDDAPADMDAALASLAAERGRNEREFVRFIPVLILAAAFIFWIVVISWIFG